MGYMDFKIPVLKNGYHNVTSDFGLRYIFGSWSGHNGIDIVGKNGADDIIAYADGVVTYARDDSPSAGVYVVIHHGDNLYTRYMHMKSGSRAVNIGDKVKRGQKIGYMGTTGRSTGVHLHFDITPKGNKYGEGEKVDPKPYLMGEIGPSTDPVNVAPTILDITQPTSTTINITGNRNADPPYIDKTQIYYKWDGHVSIEDEGSYDGILTIDKREFDLDISKPRSVKYISLLPININAQNESTIGEVVGKELKESYPCIHIQTENGVKEATPYINTGGGKWELAIPTIKNNGYWYELYNTDSERVGQ